MTFGGTLVNYGSIPMAIDEDARRLAILGSTIRPD